MWLPVKSISETILFVLLSAALFSSCAKDNFSKEERKLIGSVEDGVMGILIVDNKMDIISLKTRAIELDKKQILSTELHTLYLRMLETVCAPENDGVGIAAPQIGLPYRAIIVQRFDKEGEPFEFYVNPKIEYYSSETSIGREGCLSVPDKWGLVERSTTIRVSYMTLDGKKTSESVEGFTAVIFQHEIDHLDGILYLDRTSEVFTNDQIMPEKVD